MRDKAKPPTLGFSSLSDKIKSLQNLIDNSKRKGSTNDENSDASAVAEGSATFDWQNIELTNELGTDFRSSLKGVVPLKEGSIAPELDPQNPEVDNDDIPTLETVVFKPSHTPPTEKSPPETAMQEVEPIVDPVPEPKPQSQTQPQSELELDDSSAATMVDDLSNPTLSDSIISENQTDTPGTDLETPISPLPSLGNAEARHPIAPNEPRHPEPASSEHTIDFVQDDAAGLNSPELSQDDPTTINADRPSTPHPTLESGLATYTDVSDEILLMIENKLRETIGRTLHPDVLEEIHEELQDLLRDWQEQLESKSN